MRRTVSALAKKREILLSQAPTKLYTDTGWGDSDYTVWESPYALSLAYGVNEDLADLEIHDTYTTPFERMNAVVGAMLGEDVEIFKPVAHNENIHSEGMMRSSVAGHLKFEKVEAGGAHRINITLTAPDDKVLYCYFPSDYLRECYLYVNGLKYGSVFGNESDRIIELGRFEAGEEITASLEPLSDNMYIANEGYFFWQLDEEAFGEYMPRLSDNQYIIDKYSDDSFSGSINIGSDSTLVFTSIPFDEGWQIKLDGKKVPTFEVLDGLIAFRAEPGEHTLTMKYRPACLYYGLAVSVTGAALFACAWIVDETLRKKRIMQGAAVYEEDIHAPDTVCDVCPPIPTVFDDIRTSGGENSDRTDGSNDTAASDGGNSAESSADTEAIEGGKRADTRIESADTDSTDSAESADGDAPAGGTDADTADKPSDAGGHGTHSEGED